MLDKFGHARQIVLKNSHTKFREHPPNIHSLTLVSCRK